VSSLVTLVRPDAGCGPGRRWTWSAAWPAWRSPWCCGTPGGWSWPPSGRGGANAADVAGLQNALDLSFHLTATVMMVVLTVKIAVDLWRLFGAIGPRWSPRGIGASGLA
jgi:hypothetical protein